jgi:hypothetical protein
MEERIPYWEANIRPFSPKILILIEPEGPLPWSQEPAFGFDGELRIPHRKNPASYRMLYRSSLKSVLVLS